MIWCRSHDRWSWYLINPNLYRCCNRHWYDCCWISFLSAFLGQLVSWKRLPAACVWNGGQGTASWASSWFHLLSSLQNRFSNSPILQQLSSVANVWWRLRQVWRHKVGRTWFQWSVRVGLDTFLRKLTFILDSGKFSGGLLLLVCEPGKRDM